MQLYQGLPILTGAADALQQAQLEHRLLGFVPIHETYSAGAFAQRAHEEIDGLIAQHRRPIVVGGTGLYLRAALADLDLRPPVDPAIRARIAARDLAELHAELPPDLNIRPTDRQRIVRAHELLATGELPHATSRQLWTEHTRHPTLLAALVMDRERALRAHRRPRGRDGRGRRGRGSQGRGTQRERHRAPRRRLRGAAPRRRRGHEDATPAATPSASSRGCASCPARTASTSPTGPRRTSPPSWSP